MKKEVVDPTWVYREIFYMLYLFYKKYGNASGQILYTSLLLDKECQTLFTSIKNLDTPSIDPYTLFSILAGKRLNDSIKTKRINWIFRVLDGHCKYDEIIDFPESDLPQFGENDVIEYWRIPMVNSAVVERNLETQNKIWKVFEELLDSDVPYCAFTEDIYKRCSFHYCTFSNFTIFLHSAVDDSFFPLTAQNRKMIKERNGIKRCTYKNYSSYIGVVERTVGEREEYKNPKYLL